LSFTGFFCTYLILGTTTWLVMQVLAVPLRPVLLRPAFQAIRNKWKRLLGTGLMSTAITGVGYLLCVIPGLVLSVLLALVAPVVMMENSRGFAAMKRSKDLTLRSLRTTALAVAILFLVPLMITGATSQFVAMSVKSFADFNHGAVSGEVNTASDPRTAESPNPDGPDGKWRVRFGARTPDLLTGVLTLPVQILLTSLSSVVVALLYLKTRQAGGESLQDLLSQFEEADQPRKKWQERVRQRLLQSGRTTSKQTT
jgi:hypothetical protein